MSSKLKTIYLVQAWDIQQNKLIQFNQLLTKTYEDALKLIDNLNNNLKDYFKDVKLITEMYELKQRIVEEVKD